MSPAEDADFIETAVDWLRVDPPHPDVIKAATTALTDYVQNREWMARAARHIAGRPWCCRAGAAHCAYAGWAFLMARRILAAASGRPAV